MRFLDGLHAFSRGERCRFAASPLFVVAALLALTGAAVFVGAVPTRVFGHDIFLLLGNGWRTICGQRPHVDYSSPWGPLTFLLVAVGMRLSHLSVDGIGCASALLGLFAGASAFHLARRRL